jgi:hypothetical protein
VEQLKVFKFLNASWIFYEDKQKCSTSKKMNERCHFLLIVTWQFFPSLLLADGRYQCELAKSQLLSNNPGEFSRGCPITFGHFLYPFSSAQTLSNSLLEHFPVAMGKR